MSNPEQEVSQSNYKFPRYSTYRTS